MGLEETANIPVDRFLGPLPESAFVVAARDSIPQSNSRVTTATTRGSLRGRGRGRSTSTREPSIANTSTRARGRGHKRSANSSTGAAPQDPEGSTSGRARKRGYNTGRGSAHYLLFGDQQPRRTKLPDLNVEVDLHEFVLSQNAPPADDV